MTPNIDNNKVQIFFNYLWPKMYQTLTNTIALEAPATMSQTELMRLIKQYVCPSPENVVARLRLS